MSTDPPAPSPLAEKLVFTPLHRTKELEDIHAQVIQNDPTPAEAPMPSTRKILVKHMTVIGDGSDVDSTRIVKY